MKLKIFFTSLILFSFSSAYSIEADVWEYKVLPGHMNEAVVLFEEAIKLSKAAGRNTSILQQTFGKGGEFNRKYANKLMRLRILAQFMAVAIILLFVYLSGSRG